jgi:hypothetical protein
MTNDAQTSFVAFAMSFLPGRRGLYPALRCVTNTNIALELAPKPFPSDKTLNEQSLVEHIASCGYNAGMVRAMEAFATQWISHGTTPRDGWPRGE